MRVIKKKQKQLELAGKGLLFALVNCAYVQVSSDFVQAAPAGYRFFARV